MADYEFKRGSVNVHHLTAPYELLAQAFGNDGTTEFRDEDKVQAQWTIESPDVEVYDYYSTVPKEQVTDWHVAGSEEGIELLLVLLEAAVMSA